MVPQRHASGCAGLPILAIASITPTQGAGVSENLPVAQITIELYAPLPGGLAVGGTFAPESLEVPHMMKAGPAGEHEHPEAPAASPYR